MEDEETKTSGVCKCGKPSLGLHSCPYAEEINDDYDEEHCDCCEDCQHECAMDI